MQQELLSAIEHHQAGKIQLAKSSYQQILIVEPENADANHLLGLIALQEGDNEIAAQCITKALQINPHQPSFVNSLGMVYKAQGKLDDAELTFKRALNLKPDFAKAINNLGNLLKAKGKLTDAEKSYRQAIRIKPDFVEAHYNLGTVLLDQEKLDAAALSYNRALELKPDFAEALNNLGIIFYKQGNSSRSEEVFKRSLSIKPDFAQAHNNFGTTLERLGKLDEAGKAYKQALSIKPDFAEAYKNLGFILQVKGEFKEAEKCYRTAMEIKPDYAKVYLQLALLFNQELNTPHYSASHEHINKIKALLNNENIPPQNAMQLHFALGEIYDNCNLTDEAFTQFKKANLIGYETTNFSRDKSQTLTDHVINVFKTDYFSKPPFKYTSSYKPVFIVGLPRAGKTLAEKLLSVHKSIYAGGELVEINRLIFHELPVMLQAQPVFPAYANEIDDRSAAEISRKYEEYLVDLAGNSFPCISNTLSNNAILLGLLSLFFPHAKIIYCRRNAQDNCLAMYFKNFKSSYDYSYDLHDVGFFYNQYVRLMQHWKEVLPIPILEVSYEELVETPAEITPKLIDHLGLEWDAECEKNLIELLSPDNAEKTKPLLAADHSRGIGWSVKYRKFLAPLEKVLQESI
jgi:tetratricopeptide (TPR) repeat protein